MRLLTALQRTYFSTKRIRQSIGISGTCMLYNYAGPYREGAGGTNAPGPGPPSGGPAGPSI